MDSNSLSEQLQVGTVQRLEGDASQQILPRVLGEFLKHEVALLEKRAELMTFKPLRGNSKEVNAYKALLPPLTDFQTEWSVGVLLGDATLQANSNGEAFRLKMQQSHEHKQLLLATGEILKPYVMNDDFLPRERTNGKTFLELETLSTKQFTPLMELFNEPGNEIVPNRAVVKVVPPNIGDYLTPTAVSAWFCCDGGRRDYGANEGKAIQFHTQGFPLQCCERLAAGLRHNYGWNVAPRFDYKDSLGRERFLIQVEASSFESFMSEIQPLILESFQGRLPKPRAKTGVNWFKL